MPRARSWWYGKRTTAADDLVAVGIRSPEDCRAALEFAFEEASLRKAALLAVHAGQFPDSRASERKAAELDDLLTAGGASTPTSTRAAMSCTVSRDGCSPTCRPSEGSLAPTVPAAAVWT